MSAAVIAGVGVAAALGLGLALRAVLRSNPSSGPAYNRYAPIACLVLAVVFLVAAALGLSSGDVVLPLAAAAAMLACSVLLARRRSRDDTRH
jgi:hypothetical protein